MPTLRPFEYRMPRFRADFPVIVQPDDGKPGLLEGQCVDISQEGIRVWLSESLQNGCRVLLILSAPSRSLTVSALLTSCDGQFHGFAFDFTTDDQRTCLQEILASCAETGGLPGRHL